MSVLVKICGLTDEQSIDTALEEDADFLGFVFFDKSPRHILPEQAAELTQFVEGVEKVGLFVNPTDTYLGEVLSQVRLDMLQLHGSETPERLEQIRQDFALPVMKALPVATKADLVTAARYYDVADYLLFDARPPQGSDRPGGNAVAFDWTILRDFECPLPWMLAGGLHADNVAEAIRISGTLAVDVSSGVEDAPGQKSPEKIRQFLRRAKSVNTLA